MDLAIRSRAIEGGSHGYRATLESGQPVFQDEEPTGALPGRLLSGPQLAQWT